MDTNRHSRRETGPRRPARAVAVSFYVVNGLLIAVLAGELALHATYAVRNAAVTKIPLPYAIGSDYGAVPPWIDGLRILEPDPVLIWRGRPNLRRTYIDIFGPAEREADRTAVLHQFSPEVPDALRENAVWNIALNAEGFREKELPAAKPAGTFRILCLGDSWTFGANVSQADAYPEQLAVRLRDRFPGAAFEVLNLGVLGYSSFQGLRLMKRRVLELQPDLVIIGYGMNDASVAGYRDRDVAGTGSATSPLDRLQSLLERSELYRLFRYWIDIHRWNAPTLGDAIAKEAAEVARGSREAFDYRSMERWTRVSPIDYERNLREMIQLSRRAGAEVVLLFNEVWTGSPYRQVVSQLSEETGAGFVDTAARIALERKRIEQDVEWGLELAPSPEPAATGSDMDVVFRVRVPPHHARRGVYIVGPDPQLGSLVPNRVSTYDDGTHGDQRAADHVWSYTASFIRGSAVPYVYTVGGREGEWTGLDVPTVRRLAVDAPNSGTRLYAPIDTFGTVYMQTDNWHTNAQGYGLLVEALVSLIAGRPAVHAYLAGRAASARAVSP